MIHVYKKSYEAENFLSVWKLFLNSFKLIISSSSERRTQKIESLNSIEIKKRSIDFHSPPSPSSPYHNNLLELPKMFSENLVVKVLPFAVAAARLNDNETL